MPLTRLQRRILTIWWRYHTNGLGVGVWLRQCSKQWLLLGGLGTYSYFLIVPYLPAVGWGFIGLCLGACLRDVGYYQVSRRMWPVTRQLTDWQRVRAWLDSTGDVAPSAPPPTGPGT